MTETDYTHWSDYASCVGEDDYLFFEDHANDYAQARDMCAGCPVIDECLIAAIDEEAPPARRFGVRGGLSAADRTTVARKNSKVVTGAQLRRVAHRMWTLGHTPDFIAQVFGEPQATIDAWLEQEAA